MTVPGLKILFPGSRKRNPLTDNIFPISKKSLPFPETGSSV